MNDALGAAGAGQPTTYGPLIVGLIVGITVLGFSTGITFGAWIVRRLNQLGIDDVLGSKKAHDEIMDTKLATAVLDQRTLSLDARVTALESYHEATLQPKGTQ